MLVDESYESLFGGAAGGGKSIGLLCAALQYVQEPSYHALILRRTFKQLAKADSILSIAKEWLKGKAHWNGDTYTFTFPSGATLEFGHMESDDARFNYQGAAYQFVGYDELTQFTEVTYSYLGSRIRRAEGSGIPLRRRNTSNPGGIGHDWVFKRFISPKTRISSTRFIPAKLDDNPNIDRAEYIKSLSDLDPLTRDQLLRGDWNAVSGGRFRKEWFGWFHSDGDFLTIPTTGERFLPYRRPRYMTCDPAASEKTTADYTVLGTFIVSPKGNLVWWRCRRFRADIPEIIPVIQRDYRFARPLFVGVEEVASNRAVGQLCRRSVDPIMIVRSLSPGGNDKLVRATPAITLAHDGRIFLPGDDPGFPVEDVLSELCRFTGNEKEDDHDDIVDCLSYACSLLPTLGTHTGAGSGMSVIPSAVGAGTPLGNPAYGGANGVGLGVSSRSAAPLPNRAPAASKPRRVVSFR